MIVNPQFTSRQVLGALLLDLPRIVPRLVGPRGWIGIANRQDRFIFPETGPGRRCDWQWTNQIHACRVFPPLGRWLMRRAFAEWPLRFCDETTLPPSGAWDVSFVIPFRGVERIPLLLATVESVLGQAGARAECLVVEQSPDASVRGVLPSGVRYLHLPHPADPAGWRKSWAFNIGVSEAKAPIVVCHDADIPVPAGYAREVRRMIREEGYEAVHLQRFLFRFSAEATKGFLERRDLSDIVPDEIWQNWEGGTLAIRRDAFFRIGGYDERFVDWGGEDNEFYDRCSVLRRYDFGYLPFVHLWHAPQETKYNEHRERNLSLMNDLLAIPPTRRVSEITARQGASLPSASPIG